VSKWARLWRLTPAERGLLLWALALLPLTALALRLIGFRRWQTLLARLAPIRPGLNKDAATIIEEGRVVARLVDAAARHGLYRATCLPRSLALWCLLRRCGIDSNLRIGVRKEAGDIQAHAWVEYRGTVLNDGATVSERYAAFDRAILPTGESV
jgi:hypothetical protein